MPVHVVHYETLAAVDLGSNSFHLQIGRVVGARIEYVDALREPVRLGAGLTRGDRLDRAAQRRALAALGRFAERLRGFPAGAVRAVGTNALRVARNAPDFLAEAGAVLGFPIEVLYGPEEARLIYLGVSQDLPESDARHLVMDVGGGSTEFIIGSGHAADLTASLPLGCVAFSRRYFPGGRVDARAMQRAVSAAAGQMQCIIAPFKVRGWADALASSGMARCVADLVRAAGWCDHGVSAGALARLRERLIGAGGVSGAALPPLRPDRAAILPGGIAILSAAVEQFGLARLAVSDAALRQGVLYDLLARLRHADMRDETVKAFAVRYGIDRLQAQRVAALAQQLYGELVPACEDADRRMLDWAAQLHEIGAAIAQHSYQRHSAYVLRHADMPGFSRDEQSRLARIVLAHRGPADTTARLQADDPDRALVASLRLAALFLRGRADVNVPRRACAMREAGVALALPRGWLDAHPLIEAALAAEMEAWPALGLQLDVREEAPAAGTMN